MIGLVSLLAGEVLFETVRFVIMLCLLVVAVFVGGKLRAASDAKKAKKAELENSAKEDITE